MQVIEIICCLLLRTSPTSRLLSHICSLPAIKLHHNIIDHYQTWHVKLVDLCECQSRIGFILFLPLIPSPSCDPLFLVHYSMISNKYEIHVSSIYESVDLTFFAPPAPSCDPVKLIILDNED